MSNANQCQNCSFKECEPDDRFCIKCGARLDGQKEWNAELGMTRKVSTPSDVFFRLSLIYYKRGKLEDAVRSLKSSLQDDPDNAEAKEMIEKIRLELAATGAKQ